MRFTYINLVFLLIYVSPSWASNIKLLVLVLASDDLLVYIAEQNLWRSYMHYSPDQVQAYFIKGNPKLHSRYYFDRDIIWSNTNEGHVPLSAGIINKTVMSLEALEKKLDNFDYVLRTNMSSFFVFPRLLKYLKTLPKTGVYGGVLGEGFVSGAGIIMSSDIAKLILQYKNELLNNITLNDDVLLGSFMQRHGVNSTGYVGRIDIPSLNKWRIIKNNIPSSTFHFRIKNLFGGRDSDEIYVYTQLCNMFYGPS